MARLHLPLNLGSPCELPRSSEVWGAFLCGRRPSPSASSIYIERRIKKRFQKEGNAQQRRGEFFKSLFSFHWRLHPLALLSCHKLRAPVNLRPTSEIFIHGCHRLATVRLCGSHHPSLYCSCPLPLQPLAHLCLHGLPHATSFQPGLWPIRHCGHNVEDQGIFTGLHGSLSPEKILLLTKYKQTPSK